MKTQLDSQEVADAIDSMRTKLFALIEDEDHQPYFQDGKDGPSLLEGLTGIFDDMTKAIAQTGCTPKGCCSEEAQKRGKACGKSVRAVMGPAW